MSWQISWFQKPLFYWTRSGCNDEKDYADGATQLLPSRFEHEDVQHRGARLLWETVKTRNSFNYQIKLCSDLASKWKSEMPNLKLINAQRAENLLKDLNI